MAEFKQKRDQLSADAPGQAQTAEEKTKAEAQRDLMGDAAVDPQPLLDEEKDAIAQEVKRSSQSES